MNPSSISPANNTTTLKFATAPETSKHTPASTATKNEVKNTARRLQDGTCKDRDLKKAQPDANQALLKITTQNQEKKTPELPVELVAYISGFISPISEEVLKAASDNGKEPQLKNLIGAIINNSNLLAIGIALDSTDLDSTQNEKLRIIQGKINADTALIFAVMRDYVREGLFKELGNPPTGLRYDAFNGVQNPGEWRLDADQFGPTGWIPAPPTKRPPTEEKLLSQAMLKGDFKQALQVAKLALATPTQQKNLTFLLKEALDNNSKTSDVALAALCQKLLQKNNKGLDNLSNQLITALTNKNPRGPVVANTLLNLIKYDRVINTEYIYNTDITPANINNKKAYKAAPKRQHDLATLAVAAGYSNTKSALKALDQLFGTAQYRTAAGKQVTCYAKIYDIAREPGKNNPRHDIRLTVIEKQQALANRLSTLIAHLGHDHPLRSPLQGHLRAQRMAFDSNMEILKKENGPFPI